MRKALKYALATAALFATANAECAATVTSTARGNSFPGSNGLPGQVYDIVVTNTGDEPIKSLFAFFGYPANNSIIESWNYNKANGEVTLYSDLEASKSFGGAGFIFEGTASPTLAFTRPKCTADESSSEAPAESSSEVSSESSESSSEVPVESSSEVPAESSSESSSEVPAESSSEVPAESSSEVPVESSSEVPVESSESASGSSESSESECDIEASLRLGSSWTTDGVNYASYHVYIKNNGACPLVDFVTSFALNGGEIYESWNLESTLGGYKITGYEPVLHVGDSYGGAGFNVRNAGEIQITPYGSNCQC